MYGANYSVRWGQVYLVQIYSSSQITGCWKILCDRLYTEVALETLRYISLPSNCRLRGGDSESVDHLFRRCDYAHFLLTTISDAFNLSSSSSSSSSSFFPPLLLHGF